MFHPELASGPLGAIDRSLNNAPDSDVHDDPGPQLSLRHFIREAWPILEPANPLRSDWYVDCLSEHLEAVSKGQLPRLLINMPFRSSKSRVTSVFWHAWDWTLRPWRRWLFNSYAEKLSLRDAVAARRLIESQWYQERWGHLFQLTDDQNRKERYDTTRSGFRVSTSVKGMNTGEGGDISVADDPHNVEEGESDAERVNVLEWWDETMSSRFVDPHTHARVIVMQRIHNQDLAGHVLSKSRDYHHLCLPGEWEPPTYLRDTTIRDETKPQPHDQCAIYPDPRTEKGQPLDSYRFSAEVLAGMKNELGVYAYAGQVQQRPVPRTGAIFEEKLFRDLPPLFDVPDEFGLSKRQSLLRLTFFDLNYSEKGLGDHAAGVTVGIDSSRNIFVLDVWHERHPASAVPEMAAYHIFKMGKNNQPAIITGESAAFRHVASQNALRILREILFALGLSPAFLPPQIPQGDKASRARMVADFGKVGQLYADKAAPWWPDYIEELTMFLKTDVDDRTDATSGAVAVAIEIVAQQAQYMPEPQKVLVGEAADPYEDAEDWISQVFDGRTRLVGGGLGPG
jgi:predicted phage terminase large subunit-like protein